MLTSLAQLQHRSWRVRQGEVAASGPIETGKGLRLVEVSQLEVHNPAPRSY